MPKPADVIIIGAGHNGLVAATLLARRGLRVCVVEEKEIVGGAARTERPFKKVPGLGTSTGAYLLGLMPPELIKILNIELPLLRRDPHYFLPTTGSKYLLFGSNEAEMRRQFVSFFSEQDWRANEALQLELSQLREDIAPTWLQEPLSIEATAEKFVRAELRQIFIDLCRKPVRDYLERFGFRSELVKAMYAVTDGFSGLFGSWDTPGTGMNFLIHNMCRLPGSDGTWMIVRGGMGTVTQQIAQRARESGAEIMTGHGVKQILSDGAKVDGVKLQDGTELRAPVVIANADPFRMRSMLGSENLPSDYNARLDSYRKDGSTMKINLCLKALPKFKCLLENRGQFNGTIHLLPEGDVLGGVRQAFDEVRAGQLPAIPTIEWYIHTTVDSSLQDEQKHHNSALFIQWVPFEIRGSSWDAEESGFVKKMLAICDRFAPGTSDLVVDTFPLTPPKIEQYFGISRGHIHHVDNSFGFADRLPYATPIQGLYSCSAGCHPAGSVIGCAGHNAAMRVLRDLGK
jgi:phytoene dehydrogenase-like protein